MLVWEGVLDELETVIGEAVCLYLVWLLLVLRAVDCRDRVVTVFMADLGHKLTDRVVNGRVTRGDLVEAIQASFAGDEDNRASNSDTRLVVLELDADPATAASSLHRIDGALEPTSDGTRTRYTALVDSHE